MGKSKGNRKPKSKRLRAKYAQLHKYGNLITRINGKLTHVVNDYIGFLKKLDDPNRFLNYRSKIQPFSRQWNNIRKKHITSSQLKRLLSWKKESAYIYSQITKYVFGKYLNRGSILEKFIIKLLKLNGMTLESTNEIWIHPQIPWLSCTVDGIVYHNGIPIALAEIKTFTSESQLKKNILNENGKHLLSKQSRAYYQLQCAGHIINCDILLLVFKYKFKVKVIVVEKEPDFICRVFGQLRELYFKYIVPFNIYGLPKAKANVNKVNVGYFTDRVFERLMMLLRKYEENRTFFEGITLFGEQLKSNSNKKEDDIKTDCEEKKNIFDRAAMPLEYEDLEVFYDEIEPYFIKYRITKNL